MCKLLYQQTDVFAHFIGTNKDPHKIPYREDFLHHPLTTPYCQEAFPLLQLESPRLIFLDDPTPLECIVLNIESKVLCKTTERKIFLSRKLKDTPLDRLIQQRPHKIVYSDFGGWDHPTLVEFPVQISEATLTQSLVHYRSTNWQNLVQ